MPAMCRAAAFFFLALFAARVCGQALPSHVRAVRADAAPGGNGESWAAAYNDLQAALDAAAASGGQVTELWISEGAYLAQPRASGCGGFVASGVSLYGGFAGWETSPVARMPGARSVLSGELLTPTPSCGSVLEVTGTVPLTLDGFVIEGAGRASGLRFESGGRIFNVVARAEDGPLYSGQAFQRYLTTAPLLIERCDFESHFWGPGTMRIAGAVTVLDSRLVHSSSVMGDGVWFDTVVARRSEIRGSGDMAGGFLAAHIDAEDCMLGGSGGMVTGMTIRGGELRRCTILQSSDYGLELENVRLLACGITTVGYSIRGMHASGATLYSCVLRVNSMGGPIAGFSGDSSVYVNCTFHNCNGSLSFDATSSLENCIVWRDSGPVFTGAVRFPLGVTGLVNSSCIQGWTGDLGGIGNTGADPMLNPDLTLGAGSACIDAGSNAALTPEMVRDRAGNCRVTDGDGNGAAVVDMGAFESAVCYANCDCSTGSPALNAADFVCFLERFASGEAWANCDGSAAAPALNVADFTCFLRRFAAGCP